MLSLWEVTSELTHRLITLFTRDENGRRPIHGDREKFQSDPHWRDLMVFYSWRHRRRPGSSHQTGWTGVVAKLIQQYAEYSIDRNPRMGAEFGIGAWKKRADAK